MDLNLKTRFSETDFGFLIIVSGFCLANWKFFLKCLLFNEAERVPVFEHIQTMAVGNGQTAPADGVQTAVPAIMGSGSVIFGKFRMVDLRQPVLQHIADGGGKFPTGVDVTIRQKCHEIEGCTTTVAGTTSK